MAASLKVSELNALTSVAAADLFLIADADVSISKKVTLANLEGSVSLANLGTRSIDNLSDVDITTAAPTAHQLLKWDAVNSKFVPTSDITTLLGISAGDTNLGTFTGSVITDETDLLTALQDIETAIEANDQAAATASSVSEIDGNVNDLITLTGIAENVTTLGTFTGSTIADNVSIKPALQALETEVETKADSTTVSEIDSNVDDLISLTGVSENTTNLGVFSGSTIDDSVTLKAALQALETAVETEAANRATAISDLVGGAPGTLDTLNEIAAALNDDANAASSLTALINANETHIDNMATLTGVAKDSTDLGTFTGSTISDNLGVKSVLQEIESALEETDANTDSLVTLSGVAENASNLGTFTGTTIADGKTVKAAIQALESAFETEATATDEIDANVDDLVTLSGLAENSTEFNTTGEAADFSGTTLAGTDLTIKSALQAIANEVEDLTLTHLDIDGGTAGTIATTSLFVIDEGADGTNKKATGAALATFVAAQKSVKDLKANSTTADAEPANYYFLVVDASDGSVVAIDKEFVETEG